MEDRHSSHSTWKIGYHIVWCVKYRKKALVGEVEKSIKQALVQSCFERGWEIPAFEVMPDHVHCFVQAPPMVSPTQIVRTLKSISARTCLEIVVP